MLLAFAQGIAFHVGRQRSCQFGLAGPEHGHRPCPAQRPPDRSARRAFGIGRGIGQDHHRCLQALRPVHRHHPDGVQRRGRVARDRHRPAIEPVEKPLQRRRRFILIGQRRAEQLLDRVAGFLAEPADEPAPSVQRTGQDMIEKAIGRLVIGPHQQVRQAIDGRRIASVAHGGTQAALPPESHPVQLFLAPAEQRRHQQRRQRQIILRLHREPGGRQQIAHRQRRIEPQPIDACHRHPLRVQPRDDQRRQRAPLAHQDQDILGAQRPPPRFEHQAIVDPDADLPGEPRGEGARGIVDPPFLARVVRSFVLVPRAMGFQQGDRSRPAPETGMRFGGILQPERVAAQIVDQLIDQFEDRRRRSERLIERQRQDGPAGLRRLPFEYHLGGPERFGIGALETEDRLLEIADGEDRSHSRRSRALAGEELPGQHRHDRPLFGIGILRLVDQDVIGLPVELVPDPVTHAVGQQQPHRRADEIVEIHQPGALLGAGIERRIALARAQARRDQPGQRRTRSQREQGRARGMQTHRDVGIMRHLRGLPLGEGPGLAVGLRPDLVQIGQTGGALRWIARAPRRDPVRARQRGLGAPGGIGLGQRGQTVDIERIVGACRGDDILHVAQRNTQRTPQTRLDPPARPQLRQRIRCPRALDQIGFRPPLAQPAGQRLNVADQRQIAPAFGIDQHVRQHPAGQRRLLASFDRAETGRQPGFGRKSRQQRLAEGMDGLDPQPAASRLEHAREQGPRKGDQHRIVMILAQREDLLAQLGIVQPNPGGQPPVDPVRHLRRPGLREGQAQDRRGIDARQQQAHHPRRQDMRLARSRRRRKPHHLGRIGRQQLFAAQRDERLQPIGHRCVHTIRRAASADRNRHRGHIPDAAWP